MSFTFITHQGSALTATFPGRRRIPEGSLLVAEFDDNSGFRTPVAAGVVTYDGAALIWDLTILEVATIKSGWFRISRVNGNTKKNLVDGYLDYHASPVTDPGDPITGLAPIASTGNYNDLVNKPTLVTQENVNETVASALQAHSTADEPHPVYDDLPSLTLLFENGLI